MYEEEKKNSIGYTTHLSFNSAKEAHLQPKVETFIVGFFSFLIHLMEIFPKLSNWERQKGMKNGKKEW